MSIASLLFLFVFLPLSLAIYYISNDRVKEYVLLVISLLFYAIGSVEYLLLFALAVSITVIIGRTINSCDNLFLKRLLLLFGIVINAGMLLYFKYTNFAITTWGQITSTEVELKEMLLPLGISFFTFKAISYLVDVYNGKAELDDNPVHDALYLSFFAQIQSGPITRYNSMSKNDINKSELFCDGVTRFVIGFNKKVLIANVLANITNEVFGASLDTFSTSYAWLGSICYSLQLFFDFAGYSDMAIGISEMFGYKCMENFNYPYMTESVSKFWRRWHISLSEWFRDYVYFPLGGSKTKNKWKVYFNLFVVWALTGIWHGAAWNFIAWGLGYFIVISFERLTGLPHKFKTAVGKTIYRILSLMFINFQWVLFNSTSIIDGLRFIKRMIVYRANDLASNRTLFLLKEYAFFIVIAVILCFPIVPWLEKKLSNNKVIYRVFEIAELFVIILAFAWAISFVVAGQNNPFAYANF